MRGILRSADERAQLLAAFRDSGLSVSAFAARAGVANSTFYQWLQRDRTAALGVPMARVVLKKIQAAAQPPSLHLHLDSGVSVRLGGAHVAIERNFDRATLEAVLAVLGSNQTHAA